MRIEKKESDIYDTLSITLLKTMIPQKDNSGKKNKGMKREKRMEEREQISVCHRRLGTGEWEYRGLTGQ